MAIDISKVVSVDFNVVQQETAISSYQNTVDISIGSTAEDTITTYTNLEDAIAGDYAARQYDAFVYFQLGGKRLTSIKIGTTNSASTKEIYNTLYNYKNTVSNTENDFICVCVSACSQVMSNLNDFMTSINNATAPNKLLVLASSSKASDVTEQLREVDNLIFKLYKSKSVEGGVIDDDDETNPSVAAELTIAAYLASINLTVTNSMRDYCYTDESDIINYASTTYDRTLVPTDVTSDDYDTYKNYLNFIDRIGNNYVNFGGNTVLGTSVIAEWGAIAVENSVIYGVLRVMLQKQYLTDTGLNNVVSEINSIMSDYIINGFLQTDSTYTGVTRYKNYNGVSYILVENNQEIPNGYVILTIPMSRLSPADRQARKFTPIYVFMQTMGGAREVEISGDILD